MDINLFFSHMVEDLKDLEEHGIVIEENTVVRGTLCAIVGDNLGSHCIGGFTENFSSSIYFCRYCQLDRTTFENHPFTKGAVRNVQSYNETIQSIQENPDCEGFGLKFSSIFNSLKYFHVCQPGLPPCLGHDLFEGVVARDVALFIKFFVKTEKFFT